MHREQGRIHWSWPQHTRWQSTEVDRTSGLRPQMSRELQMSSLDPQHEVQQVLVEDDQQGQGLQQELGMGAVWLLRRPNCKAYAKGDVVKL